MAYGGAAMVPALVELATASFAADGIPTGRITAVSGAMDGVERILMASCRTGDRVAVEDPGYPRVFDVAAAHGLARRGRRRRRRRAPGRVAGRARSTPGRRRSCAPRGRRTRPVPRSSERRRRQLRPCCAGHPDVLTIEDDHASAIAGAPARTLATGSRERWAVVRSVAKTLGPDLRVALVTGDERTVDLVEGRLRLGPGWVSHLLQRLVVSLERDARTAERIEMAATTYAMRRESLIDALGEHGIGAVGASGLNVWIPVDDEQAVTTGLFARGWAVTGGQRFRMHAAGGVRVTTATLDPPDGRRFADDLAAVLASGRGYTPEV